MAKSREKTDFSKTINRMADREEQPGILLEQDKYTGKGKWGGFGEKAG